MEKLNEQQMETIAGGRIRPKYVSAFYCEYCRQTIHLSGNNDCLRVLLQEFLIQFTDDVISL